MDLKMLGLLGGFPYSCPMFIGHLGVGFASKRLAPQVPLGVLLLLSQGLDQLCGLFVILGIEHMGVAPGNTVMSPLLFISYPWSHGLLMALTWSIAVGIVSWKILARWQTGLVLGGLVFSHWVLDLIVHKPDLPLLFDQSTKVGLGLWNSVAGTHIAEFSLFGFGALIYFRMTKAKDAIGLWALVGIFAFFSFVYLMNHYGPPPPVEIPERLLVLPIFVFVLLLPWGNWIDRHRKVTHPGIDIRITK
jgi:hypothetical protein